MILEWLKSTTTSAPAYVRSLGLVHEAVAIDAKASRRAGSWAQHWENCKSVLRQAAETLSDTSEIQILGSGGLHDLDIDFLSQLFESVALVDLVHTRRTRKVASKLRNTECVTFDVTGIARAYYNWKKSPVGKPPSVPPSVALPRPNATLTVSLNLASQLALPFKPIILKNFGDEAYEAFDREVRESHIETLRNQSGHKIIITDIERHYWRGQVKEVEDVWEDVKLPFALNRKWIWSISPPGESKRYDKVEHLVGAYEMKE
jgi:hypothetical protein